MHHWRDFFRLIAAVIFLTLVLTGLVWLVFNFTIFSPREDVHLGLTYSARYARDLGVDPHAAYLALLDQIGVKRLRLPVYWDQVEAQRGQYDFADLDWQIRVAHERQVEIILAIGQRTPRWPECHIPDWVGDDTAVRQGALLKYLTEVVKYYRSENSVKVWQVENEPFLTRFGECPPLDAAFLDQEIALVHSLDSDRPVLLTDSGELSLWVRAASRGDRFGTTLYRKLWHPRFGYITYPIGPNFFRFKAWLVRLFTTQERFSVIELQAEPWASGWVGNVSLEEQSRTMNAEQLAANVDYARRVGFQEIYLWGGEWWYWLKERHGDASVWEEAKILFARFP